MPCTLLQPLVPCIYVGVVYILPAGESCVAVINIAIITIALVAVYTLLIVSGYMYMYMYVCVSTIGIGKQICVS